MQIKADILTDPKGRRHISLTSEHEHQERLGKVPGARYDNTREDWDLPLRWTSCVAMHAEFGAEFVISDELEKWGQNELATRVGPAMALRDRLDLTGIISKPGDPSTAIAEAAETTGTAMGLFPHQRAGAAFVATTGGQAMILDEQGTGKSAQTIAAALLLHRAGHQMFPMLIVTPATVKTHWERELAQWYPGKLVVQKVGGSADQRRKQLTTPAHVYIMNFDLLPKHSMLAAHPGAAARLKCKACGGFDDKVTEQKCQYHVRELNTIKFGTVVVDEAQRVTKPKTAWTRALWAVSDKAEHRIALTGTPVQDTLEDLWAILRFVAPEEFSVKGKFLDRYAVTSFNHWGAMEVQGVNPLHADELQKIIRPYMRRMLKSVVLPFLPPLVYEQRTVEMTGAQAKAYRDMKKTMMAELDAKYKPTPGATATLVQTSPLTKATRLMQFASSYAEITDPGGSEPDPDNPGSNIETPATIKLKLPSNKVTSFMADVAAGDYDSGAGTVVFAQSKQILTFLSAEMTKQKIDHGLVTGGMTDAARDAAIDAFQAGRTKFILVSIQAGNAGLTLTAADTMVYLQRAWSSTQMEQSKARAHRIGSEVHDSVRIVDYLSEKTIEKHQLESLAGKGRRIQEILKDDEAFYKWMQETDK